MAERLILTLMVIFTAGVARVIGVCSRPPQLENGSPTDEFTSETLFDVGNNVTYRCYLGYVFKERTLKGSRSVTCREDSTWTPLQAICEPRNCGNPGEILNGYYEASNSTFGSKVTFHCNTGYQMVGRNYQLCKADGWDGQIPTCEALTCDDLPPISNGTAPSPPYGDYWEHGMVAKYSCNDGYSLIGAERLVCAETREWDSDPPTCKAVQCYRPDLPANGRIEAGFGPTYRYQETISFSCNEGFEMVGNSVIECKEENTFVPGPPTCKPRNCDNPGEILNGYYEASISTFGSKVTFHCNTGYQMVGRNYQLCKADGWDGQIPTCEALTCDDLPPISNGTAPSPPYGDYWEHGMVAKYSCDDGYSLIGAERLVCTETREWDSDPPMCKVVKCHRPDLPANGQIEAGFGPTYRYQETISFSCNEGFAMVGNSVIECKEDNTFVPGPPICKPVQCHRPDPPANGRIKAGFGPTYRYQETISISCNEGFEMVGNSVIECKKENTFVPGPPTCKARNCGNPGEILNGYYEAPVTSFGTKATFYCNTGYQMVGRNYRLCKADGWDGQIPTCEGTKMVPVLIREIGKTKHGPPPTNAPEKQGLGTTGIIVSCVFGICVGIGGAAGLSYYNKRQHNNCKKVHINPQPNESQVEANFDKYCDHPA
ncbi:C4b-binding protein-like [Heptranchias perlo]|uniref:C4b-binding protein-like n=1 Tax=Heptranchias perlo TaxID=212740 RepID=UPI00355AB882